MTIAALLAEASSHIARRDAEFLLAHALARPRTFLLAHPEHEPAPSEIDTFRALIKRRANGEPLQYLRGTQEFFGISLRVTPDALIPRPETEHLVEAVLDWARTQRTEHVSSSYPLRLLDVGTGSGAIALALATHLSNCEIVATDISSAALELARDNARQLGFDDVAGRHVHFVESDLLASLPIKYAFDIIVSNPPYIPTTDRATLAREVVDYEPHTALFAGADGLDVYRCLIPQAHAALRPGGLLALELGFGQATALAGLLAQWQNVRFVKDYAGIPRVALAERAI